MKNRKWLHLFLVIVCLAVFFGYRILDRMYTDSKAPEITTGTGTLEVSVQDPRTALLAGVSAKDNRDGNVTDSLVVEGVELLDPDGTINVTYAAFDKAGNVAKLTREAKYTDYESPRFTLTSPLVFAQNSNFDILSVIDAEDTLDGDISHRIRATILDETSISLLGNHEVKFRVTNTLGDTVELVLPVEVYPAGTYEATLLLKEYLVYLPVGSSFNAQSYLSQFILNKDITSLVSGMPENYALRTTGTVDTQTPGVYPVAYKVTYTLVNEANSDYNVTYTGYSKLIVVVEG